MVIIKCDDCRNEAEHVFCGKHLEQLVEEAEERGYDRRKAEEESERSEIEE